MIYGMILAGGAGTRMGNTELPKQFLEVGGKPIIVHTIRQFLINERTDKVIICVPEAWYDYSARLISAHYPGCDKIALTLGGSTRHETIANGCRFIAESFGLSAVDIAMTHDAVRPFLDQRIIEANIDGLADCEAVVTAIPAIDTIVESLDGCLLSDAPDRRFLYQAQTPQTFRIMDFVRNYESLDRAEKDSLSDATAVFLLRNKKVKIAPGHITNFKITTLDDLARAETTYRELINHE